MAYRYRTIKVNGKTKLYHRHVVEGIIGRALTTDEHVHHRNGEKWDNSPGNLKHIDGIAHIREHAEERRIYPREKQCAICGTTFTPAPTKRKRQKTCSKPCANELRSRSERATKAIIRANCADLVEAAA